MAREILFKAKRISDGEWVEGYYCKRKHYCFDRRTDDFKTVIITEFSTGGYVCFEVDHNTLCQYTGLTDKNGNKIWENDVIQYKDIQALGKVEYIEDSFCLNDIDDGKQYIERMWDKFEVIGNIFDHPELLGGGE